MNRLLRRRTSGFTIVELVLVVVVVCVLAALIALTASGVKAKNRNGERQTKIDTIQGQLESYYATANHYPSFTQINDKMWRAQHLARIKPTTLQDPRWNNGVVACTVEGQAILVNQPAPNCLVYQPTAADGGACDNDKVPCAHFGLSATLEGNETYAKTSLN